MVKCTACDKGYIGQNCSDPCPPPYYGQECASACNCTDNQYCNHVHGCIQPQGKCHEMMILSFFLHTVMISFIFVGINFCGLIENHSFKDNLPIIPAIHILLEIASQRSLTFNFVNKLNNEIHIFFLILQLLIKATIKSSIHLDVQVY